MSYSVNSPCSICTKNSKCSDHIIINGAVQTIHQTACLEGSGHLGAGEIALICSNTDCNEVPEARDPSLNEYGVDKDWWKRIGRDARDLFLATKKAMLGMDYAVCAPGTPQMTPQQLAVIAHNAAFTAANELARG